MDRIDRNLQRIREALERRSRVAAVGDLPSEIAVAPALPTAETAPKSESPGDSISQSLLQQIARLFNSRARDGST